MAELRASGLRRFSLAIQLFGQSEGAAWCRIVGDNMYLCMSSFHDLFRIMSSVPAAVLDLRSGNAVASFISRCLGPVSEVWEDSLHVILPLAPVDGGSCVDFETIDPNSIRHFAGVHHARSRSNDHLWGKEICFLVSGASVILICLISVRVQRYWNQYQGALRFPQVRALTQRTLSSCKYISIYWSWRGGRGVFG